MSVEVSIIIPCRNEEAFIGKVLENIREQDYDLNKLELLVVDGRSDDTTAAIVRKYASKHSFVRLLDNPFGVVPQAMNIGIREARGEVIVRMDAHSIYPVNYVSRLVSELKRLDADNVGGVWDTRPGNDTLMARAIAKATSSPFGIGNAQYRLEQNEVKQVDTVPYGCYRASVFEQIGLYDEELVRNQDDELNARLINNGGKIFLIPDVRIKYFARAELDKMMKMFYQYGLFKPLVNKKLGKPATVRQFFPPALVLANMGILIALFTPRAYYAFFAVWAPYLLLAGLFSKSAAFKDRDVPLAMLLPVVFIAIHLSYGWGYLVGVVKFVILGKSPNVKMRPSR